MRFLFAFVLVFVCVAPSYAGHIDLSETNITVDGVALPYLFGAETQYFRARGGSERNVDRAKVIDLWNRLLDKVQQAHMNVVSLYIPWDFHEPREGVFDFDGHLDADNDGKPDYPSRDIKTFLHMVESRGIRYAMLRPGPYINAEWGPTGFGAIPLWFLQNHPEALAVTQTQGKPKTAAFYSPVYRAYVQKWFNELYQNVLKDFVGPGKLGVFLQIDNETNYFWDSIYERDYSDTSIARYRQWLSKKYASIAALNTAYGTGLTSFSEVPPPKAATDVTINSPAWHYDWFHFHDVEIRDYYQFLKKAWMTAGLSDSQVLFTSCDSFNAPDKGLLPRLDYREKSDGTLTTMNIYPKTVGQTAFPAMDTPMKAPHDALLIASAHDQFFGNLGQWVMTTETVGGWFPPVVVTLNTRQHSYADLMGSGVKAQTIYYFHEGYNWSGLEKNDTELHFDAPLDKDMNATESYPLLQSLGQALDSGLGARLMATVNSPSQVLIAHDAHAQYPIPGTGSNDALNAASTDSAALFGAFREAGVVSEVRYLDTLESTELAKKYRLIVYSYPGYLSSHTQQLLTQFIKDGGVVAMFGTSSSSLPASSSVKYFATDPAAVWNTSQYETDATVPATLQMLKGLLKTAGINPSVQVKTSDSAPYVHAWVRASTDGGSSLLFVENFAGGARNIQLTFDGGLSLPASFQAIHRWGPLNSRLGPVAGTLSGGVALPVNGDAVDVWEDLSGKMRRCLLLLLTWVASSFGGAVPERAPLTPREIQSKALSYFIDNYDPQTGLIRDRARNFEPTPNSGIYQMASIAATGFGLAILSHAAATGSMKRADAYSMVLKTLRTVDEKLEKRAGWLYHFVDISTGKRYGDSEISTVDTAWFLAGALYAASVFPDTPLSRLAEKIYEDVDFETMRTDGGTNPTKLTLSLGWLPETGYLSSQWDTYAEQMLLYVLGLGKSKHPLPAASWSAWKRDPINDINGRPVMGAKEPLFIHQYSLIFMDLRQKRDAFANYFENSRHASYFSREHCLSNAKRYLTYEKGFWGLSAGDSPDGYEAFAPDSENGTVCLDCALASSVFYPGILDDTVAWSQASESLIGKYGFADSINLDRKWIDSDVIGITVGMLYLAIADLQGEGSPWDLFTSRPDIQRGIERAGFH